MPLPDPMKFLRGFGFFKGGRPVLIDFNLPLSYNKYKFRLRYSDRPGLKKALTLLSKETPVIKSASGRPYLCRITNFRIRRFASSPKLIWCTFDGEARKIHAPETETRRTVRQNNKLFALLHKKHKLSSNH